MWQKFKEQLPAILLTTVIIVGAAYWLHQKTVSEMTARQQSEIDPLREQNDALKAAAEANRQQIAAVNQLLQDAIAKRQTDLFMTEEEIAKLNQEKVNTLAEAIAKRIRPYSRLPKTAEEAAQMQHDQVDLVASRMLENIQPILDEMAKDQHLTQESIARYNERISQQVGSVLSTELAKNQVLNNNLIETRAAASEALQLSHELTALYLSSIKNEGLLTRLLTLPANVVKDVAHFNIVDKRDKKEIAEDLFARMESVQQRLDAIQAAQPGQSQAALGDTSSKTPIGPTEESPDVQQPPPPEAAPGK